MASLNYFNWAHGRGCDSYRENGWRSKPLFFKKIIWKKWRPHPHRVRATLHPRPPLVSVFRKSLLTTTAGEPLLAAARKSLLAATLESTTRKSLLTT
ncbi:MAG: hypothetical protein COV67_12175, partial [Nitrospinae bacterium CG11_big_fil_rev_8_21_14_0_20_56_8]